MESQNTVADRENVIVCPFCGHNNEPEASRCVECWSRVDDIEVVTKEEGIELTRKLLAVRKRRRLIRWGVAAVVILGLVGWFGFKAIGRCSSATPLTQAQFPAISRCLRAI